MSRFFSPTSVEVGREFVVLMSSIEADGEKMLFDLLLAFCLGSFLWITLFDGVFCLGSLFEFFFVS